MLSILVGNSVAMGQEESNLNHGGFYKPKSRMPMSNEHFERDLNNDSNLKSFQLTSEDRLRNKGACCAKVMFPIKDQLDLKSEGARDLTFEQASKKLSYGLWPKGKVYYQLHETVKNCPGLLAMIKAAIIDFHKKIIDIDGKPVVEWIEGIPKEKYHVEFVRNDKKNPRAIVGCWYNDKPSYISLPFPYYPDGQNELRHICVLHEMGHCIGLEHEHERKDNAEHLCNTHKIKGTGNNISFGNYDYYSIMHYGAGALGIEVASNKELEDRADKGSSFSAGDIAVIKKMYGGKKIHHGDWHVECDPSRCTDIECGCSGCGNLHGGCNCGYEGMNGHWTCCMNETKYSDCDSVHTGFWHARCRPTSQKPCTNKDCYCKNCQGGCTYVGMEAHWSCCNNTDRHGNTCKVALELMFGR